MDTLEITQLLQRIQDEQGYIILVSETPHKIGDVTHKFHVATQLVDASVVAIATATFKEWVIQCNKYTTMPEAFIKSFEKTHSFC